MKDRNTVLYSHGVVSWVNKAHISTLCYLDYEYFPFDSQVCKIKVASWTYDGFKVKLGLRKYYKWDKFKNNICHIVSFTKIHFNEWTLTCLE